MTLLIAVKLHLPKEAEEEGVEETMEVKEEVKYWTSFKVIQMDKKTINTKRDKWSQ